LSRSLNYVSDWPNIQTNLLKEALGSSAGDDWLFKGSLLVTVTKVIEAIREQSSTLGGIVVPLVRESFSPNVGFPTFHEERMPSYFIRSRSSISTTMV
jgi:hypothetical protein